MILYVTHPSSLCCTGSCSKLGHGSCFQPECGSSCSQQPATTAADHLFEEAQQVCADSLLCTQAKHDYRTTTTLCIHVSCGMQFVQNYCVMSMGESQSAMHSTLHTINELYTSILACHQGGACPAVSIVLRTSAASCDFECCCCKVCSVRTENYIAL